MNRLHILKRAEKHFGRAEKAAGEYQKVGEWSQEANDAASNSKNRNTPPRELGRLYEQRICYYLELAAQDDEKCHEYEALAASAYRTAERYWSGENLKSLLENELYDRYELKGNRVVKRGSRRS